MAELLYHLPHTEAHGWSAYDFGVFIAPSCSGVHSKLRENTVPACVQLLIPPLCGHG